MLPRRAHGEIQDEFNAMCPIATVLMSSRLGGVERNVDERRCSAAGGTLDCHPAAECLDAVDQTGQS
jgi:hypothetical protein